MSKVSAKVITDQKGTITVANTEVVNDDLFIGAQAAEINGTVNGDVFIGAQTVKITGVINGNLHVGARTLDLSGTIKGNVYAGAENILVTNSTIGGSLLLGAATANVDNNSTIGGSILAGAGTLSIDSQVKRSVYAGTGSLTIGSNAKIGKDLYYSIGKNRGQANIANGTVAGSVYKTEVNTPQNNASMAAVQKQVPAVLSALKLGTTIVSYLGALVVGLLFLKLFGKQFTLTADTVSKSFWKSLGAGFLVTIALVPGLIILLLTVIGIPLAFLIFLVFLAYAYLAKIFVGLALGVWVAQKLKWKMTAFWSFALGLLLIYVLKMIPFVGFLSGLVVLWAGLGALSLRMFSKTD